MSLIGAAFLPHGAMILNPNLPGLPPGAEELHKKCIEVGKQICDLKPDLIFMHTPHGISMSSHFGVYVNGTTASGNAEWKNLWGEYSVKVHLDGIIAESLINYLQPNIPTQGIRTFSDVSCPLRWGEVIPLYFVKELHETTKVVILSQPIFKTLPANEKCNFMIKVGQQFRAFLKTLDQSKRIFVIVSGDLAHTHAHTNNEARFLPADSWTDWEPTVEASLFDELIESWANTLNLTKLEEAAKLVNKAYACGMLGCAFLQGLLDKDFNGNVHIRKAPTYFGMMVATFFPKS